MFWTAFWRSLGTGDLAECVCHLRCPRRAQVLHRWAFSGADWQRCKVHLVRNLLAKVPRGQAEMVVAAVRARSSPSQMPVPPARGRRFIP